MALSLLDKTMASANADFGKEQHREGALRLALVLLTLGIVWLAVLPQVALVPAISARNEWLEEKQIKPSAMYYTEVEALDAKLRRMDAKLRRDSVLARTSN